MPKRGWIDEAIQKGELRSTNDQVCPYCDPEKVAITACRKHKWVNKKWYERWNLARLTKRTFQKRNLAR